MNNAIGTYNVELLKSSEDILSYVTQRVDQLTHAKNKGAMIELLRLQAFIENRMTATLNIKTTPNLAKLPKFGCPHCLCEFNSSVPVIVFHNEAVIYCPQCQERVSHAIGKVS